MLVVYAGGLERRLSPCISSPHLRYLLRSRHLSANGLISQHHHGFLAKHSTCTQLLETVNDWSIALLNRHVVDVVYFDFAKAFDSVSHTKLMCKLQAYGFDGVLLAFLYEFVTGRTQKVVLPNGHSPVMPVTSGVGYHRGACWAHCCFFYL